MPNTAERDAEILFRNLYQRVRGLLHPHHWEHEPGGKDQVSLPLAGLSDVLLSNLADTDILTYHEDGITPGYWLNTGSGEALPHYLYAHEDVDDYMVPGQCTDGDVLTFDEANQYWTNKPASGGGGIHAVHFAVPLPATVVPPGPCNITGADLTVTALRFGTDDSTVAGTLYIGATAVSIGSFGTTQSVTHTWASGALITLDLSDAGSDGSYLTVDMAAG